MLLRLIAPVLLPAICGMIVAAPARASYDECEARWRLDFTALSDCANVAALVPGNDTRANLLLLLTDRYGTPSKRSAPRPLLDWKSFRTTFFGPTAESDSRYAVGEGSRCRSDAPGAEAFTAAVRAAIDLPKGERTTLIAARTNLNPDCIASGGSSLVGALNSISSARGEAFATYLRAADDFYAGRFDSATSGFEALLSDSDSWLADTAAYMVARTAVNGPQLGAFDKYGTFIVNAADKASLRTAAKELDQYLKQFPHGRYVASAKGLERRVAWLATQTEDLASRYAALFAQAPVERGIDNATLAEEVDNKLLPTLTPAQTRDPILLTVLDLKAMRHAGPGEPQSLPPDLAGQREAFAAEPELYSYLLAAAAFYGKGDPKAVLRLIPDDTRQRDGSTLWFSRQFLRGLALDATGDVNAHGFWRDLLSATAPPLERSLTELALALDDERRRDPDDAFSHNSQIDDPALRAILLIHDAGPALLRLRAEDGAAPVHEHEVALFTLLLKELTTGQYREFLADAGRVPADAPVGGSVKLDPLDGGKVPLGVFVKGKTVGDIDCPLLAETVAHLTQHPSGARDRLCLGEWLRLNGFDPEQNETVPAQGDLGFGPSNYPGPVLTRTAIYRGVITSPVASSEDRSYALYRAVKCYEAAGYNGCGGSAAPKVERHRWYEALKRNYPSSRWAKALTYWW